MQTLRTPDDRFADLPDFPYPPRYADVPDPDGGGGVLRMAYVREGDASGPVALLLHGEPSWSFLYRHVIPVLVDAGMQVIAPDMIGFGRSDKPTQVDDHTYARHVEWLRSLLFDTLDVREATLVGQDWGGLLGLRLAAEHPDRFRAVVAANTGLPTGDLPMPNAWLRFRDSVRGAPVFDVPRSVQAGCTGTLTEKILAAYDAPFPDETFKAGARAMPGLVPTEPDDPAAPANREAWDALKQWQKPFLVAFSDRDPITGSMAPVFTHLVPGAQGVEHPVITGAGHFLQEDAGDRLAREIVTFLRKSDILPG
jgi:haloalkane dehalogenase